MPTRLYANADHSDDAGELGGFLQEAVAINTNAGVQPYSCHCVEKTLEIHQAKNVLQVRLG